MDPVRIAMLLDTVVLDMRWDSGSRSGDRPHTGVLRPTYCPALVTETRGGTCVFGPPQQGGFDGDGWWDSKFVKWLAVKIGYFSLERLVWLRLLILMFFPELVTQLFKDSFSAFEGNLMKRNCHAINLSFHLVNGFRGERIF